MKKIHDYVHCYRGYWSDGGKCRIRLYQEKGQIPVVICSQLPDNHNTSITNMAEYLAAEIIEDHVLPTPRALDSALPRARGKDWRVLVGEVHGLGTERNLPWGSVALQDRIT